MEMKEEGNGDEKRTRVGRVGGKRGRCSSEQTECPQTKTHGARVIPTLPRWLPPEVVLCRTNPEPCSAPPPLPRVTREDPLPPLPKC